MSIKTLSKPLIIIAATSVLSLGVGGYVWREEHRPKVLEVYVFALKSGRSMFVRTPNDKRILIDGGANSDIIRELTKILPFYSRRIDTLVATNSDGKNIAGLIDVLDRYKVDSVYIPALTVESLGLASSTDRIYETFTDHIHTAGIEIHEVKMRDKIDLDTDVSMNVLFPASLKQASSNEFSYSKASAPELLFNIKNGATTIDFIGNASVKIQKYVAAKLASSTTRSAGDQKVLVVSHSALPASMSVKLVEQLKPSYLIYSKTLNTISVTLKVSMAKTPKKSVTDSLKSIPSDNRLNLKEKGTIHLVSDGKTLKIFSGND